MFKMGILRRWWDPEPAKQQLLANARGGVKAAAEFMADRARAYCPVDTGRLRESIHVVGEADGSRQHVIATEGHAEAQEFGFIHYISKQFVPPKAYMRKALRDTERAWPQFMKQGTRVDRGYHAGRVMGATFE